MSNFQAPEPFNASPQDGGPPQDAPPPRSGGRNVTRIIVAVVAAIATVLGVLLIAGLFLLAPYRDSEFTTVSNDHFSVQYPGDWKRNTAIEEKKGPPDVAVQGDGASLLLNSYDKPPLAEDQAIYAAAGLVDCRRLSGQLDSGAATAVIFCPTGAGQVAGARTFAAFDNGERSVLLLIGTRGGTAPSDAAPIVEPILESFTWK